MSTYIPATLRRRIRARFVERCAYCLTAEALIAATFEIEHIIPHSADVAYAAPRSYSWTARSWCILSGAPSVSRRSKIASARLR